MAEGLIDFHHHARPAAFFDALRTTGRTSMGGRPLPPGWTADAALEMMDRAGIATAIVSAPDADLIYRDRAIAVRLSRLLNEQFAATIALHPVRFGAFASLPMPHLDASLRELDHAIDVLRLDGIMLSTSYDGTYLGDPDLDLLMVELDRRRCLVFVHPVTPLGSERASRGFPASLLEYAFDTTRCIASLVHHRIAERFPGVRFIFSHAGGAIPFLVPRLTLMPSFMSAQHALDVERDRSGIVSALRAFHYDVALSVSDPVLALMRDVIGTERLVFGSDYPQVSESFIVATIAGVLGSKAIDTAARRGISRANGLRLLPHLDA